MQTFLPLQSFANSAATLDQKRLGKQRVENLQIMQSLTGLRISTETRTLDPKDYVVEEFQPGGWVNHPAVRMWRGYDAALMLYQSIVCSEWVHKRGYRDTCAAKTLLIFQSAPDDQPAEMPPWLGDPDFHRSHQSNLIRKSPEHYGPLFPGVPDDLEYVWPV